MRHLVAAFAAFFVLSVQSNVAPVAAASAPVATVTGIPLDAQWKVTIYHLARTKFLHPAWGWQHCERNYQVAMRLAKGDGLKVDPDVLFAASFLHDMAAFPPYAKGGVEHGDRAAQTSEAVLRDAGFPMSKFAAVQAAERGHMYYSNPGVEPEAIVLHDADSLDFLGSIGAARMIALTGEKAHDFGAALTALRSLLHDVPTRLLTKTGRRIGAQRAAELQRFLDDVHTESFDGKAM
jgi:uncharacterized protein